MKFILGVFVGAALILGSAYLHDTRRTRRPEAAIRELGHGDRNAGALGATATSEILRILYRRPARSVSRKAQAPTRDAFLMAK
jgi:hypothetical protein